MPIVGLEPTFEGHSKINLRLVGKNKRVVIASKRTLSSDKELLFLLNAYPQTFSQRSVGVISDETWTLSSPLPSGVRYVFWDRKRILLTEFMAPGTTITSEVYCETLNNLRKLIKKNDAGCSTKGFVLLDDNARRHTAARTNALIKLFNWEIFDHPPYSPDLAPKRLPSLLQDEGLVGYPTLPHQRRAHEWRQNMAE